MMTTRYSLILFNPAIGMGLEVEVTYAEKVMFEALVSYGCDPFKALMILVKEGYLSSC
jgi:hypothetical protein